MSDTEIAMLVAGTLAFWLSAVCAFLILIGHRRYSLGLFASILYTGVGLIIMFGFGGLARSFPAIMLLMLIGGWFLYAYRRYGQARQDEVLHVITTAAEAGMPLAPAVAAYIRDRPREGKRVWDAALAFAFPPGYLLWVQRQVFDDRAARLAGLLAAGAPLPDALRIVRGVAPREVRIAAEVGDTTGRLAACLRRVDRDRLAGVWLEVMPRILYPLILLLFVTSITLFLGMYIAPKFKRIFDDFGEPLPAATTHLFSVADWLAGTPDHFAIVLFLVVPVAMIVLVSFMLMPWVRWHLPLVSRLYRWEAQGLVLRMLGAMLEVGRPAPEALGLLADTPDVPAGIRPRLSRARSAVARGEPFATALRTAGVLPASMAPLVQSSERLRALPFALVELGEVLSGRAVRIARRASLVVGPLLVLGIGVIVGFVVIALFLPLIQILTRLSV